MQHLPGLHTNNKDADQPAALRIQNWKVLYACFIVRQIKILQQSTSQKYQSQFSYKHSDAIKSA